MPADSEDSGPGLPHAFRPLGVRIAVLALGVLLVAATAATWLAFPQEIRVQFTLFQKVTVAAFGLAYYVAGYALARCRVVARQDSLTVVNGYRTRRFEWNQVLAVNLRAGSPWATLDLSDGTSVAAMGIQGSDGARAVRHVKQLRRLVNHLTR